MPRRPKPALPSYFHVLNRSVRRARLFGQPDDYRAFMRVLGQAQQRVPMTLHAYCVMPNHFHLIVGPTLGPNLSAFMHRLTLTHSNRWHRHFGTRGTGPVYQGRFKAFVIENDEYFWAAIRYVHQNPVRTGLVSRAEDWPWSSSGSDSRNREGVEVGTLQK